MTSQCGCCYWTAVADIHARPTALLSDVPGAVGPSDVESRIDGMNFDEAVEAETWKCYRNKKLNQKSETNAESQSSETLKNLTKSVSAQVKRAGRNAAPNVKDHTRMSPEECPLILEIEMLSAARVVNHSRQTLVEERRILVQQSVQ